MRLAALILAVLPCFSRAEVVDKFTVGPVTTWNGRWVEWQDREYWVAELVTVWDSVDQQWVEIVTYRQVTVAEWAETVVGDGYEPG